MALPISGILPDRFLFGTCSCRCRQEAMTRPGFDSASRLPWLGCLSPSPSCPPLPHIHSGSSSPTFRVQSAGPPGAETTEGWLAILPATGATLRRPVQDRGAVDWPVIPPSAALTRALRENPSWALGRAGIFSLPSPVPTSPQQ